MTASPQQISFTGGEWAPSLHARVDLAKYSTAAETVRNFVVHEHGGASNRPGTKFVVEVKDSSKAVRLIPFQFSVVQAYVLEVGENYIRFIKDGGQVVYPVGHASAGQPVEVATDYAEADLFDIDYTQSADVLYLTHPSYPVKKLERYSDSEWVFSNVSFASKAPIPANVSRTVGSSTTNTLVVTSTKDGEESEISAEVQAGNTDTIGWDLVLNADKYSVYKKKYGIFGWIADVAGDTTSFTDSTISPDLDDTPPTATNPFSADPVLTELSADIIPTQSVGATADDSTGGGWTGTTTGRNAGNCYSLHDEVYDTSLVDFNAGGTYTLVPDSAVQVSGMALYSAGSTNNAPGAFKLEARVTAGSGSWIELTAVSGETGWSVGEKRTYTFTNTTDYEEYRVTFTNGSGGGSFNTFVYEVEMYTGTYSTGSRYPGHCCFHQQRLILSRTDSAPQSFWGSQTGHFENFNTSVPLREDDAYNFTLYDQQMNEIVWMVSAKNLQTGTIGNEWSITGGASGITPTNISAEVQSRLGSKAVKPVLVGNSTLFVQRGGQVVRDYSFSFESDNFVGTDLSLLANHLFDEAEVKDWAYQRNPYSVVWTVMDDGELLGMTYNREQQVVAWHRHDTEGTFESVAAVQDEVYFIVNRTIDGGTVRYAEQLKPRFLENPPSPEQAFFVDSGLTYDSTPATSISGLDHLEGEDVAVLADGNVVEDLTVSSGAITLPVAASVVHVGLPITAQLGTLDMYVPLQDGSNRKEQRGIVSAVVEVENTREVYIGPDSSSLTAIDFRDEGDAYSDPIALYTGDKDIPVHPGNQRSAKVFIEVRDPVPCTVLSVIPRVDNGDF